MAGIPVTGAASFKGLAGQFRAPSLPARLSLARWTGSFDGHAFSLTVSLKTSALADTASMTAYVDGTFGSQAARFVIGPEPATATTLSFHGTVGTHHVTGTVRPASHRGSENEATATFTVTG